ncbi:MAG: hypothetical protein JXA30_06775 [Deltaproteobacteria bacterium]|nr:hypothetical protein [Deltaproteobacteria bacterium]
MTQSTKVSFVARILERLSLRFPTLFLVLAILTLVDFVVPDFIPFLDEIGLALLTVLFGMWKNRQADSRRPH